MTNDMTDFEQLLNAYRDLENNLERIKKHTDWACKELRAAWDREKVLEKEIERLKGN